MKSTLSVLLALLPLCASAGEVLVADTFTEDISAVQAWPLDGRRTEKGRTAWQSRGSDAQVSPEGVLTTPGGTFVAAVGVPATWQVIRVEADIDATGHEYICIGLGGDMLEPSWWNKEKGSQLMVLLRPSGFIGAYSRGSQHAILPESTRVPLFKPKSLTRVELIYDAGKNVVSVKANGATLLENHSLALIFGEHTPVITTAGVHFLAAKAGVSPAGRLDNFAVTKL